MTKKERVLATLRGETPDRPPVCFWQHFGALEPKQTVAEHVRFFQESGEDILKMMCDEFFEYPLQGAKTPADFLALRPLGRDSYYVRGQVERATQINEALKGEVFSLYNAFSPYASLKHAMGDAPSMKLIREAPEAAQHIMKVICEDTCYMIEGILKESGTAGMMLPLQGADDAHFTTDEYAAIVAPTEKEVIECADALSRTNLLHFCGWDNLPNHLEWWDKYPGAMINWDVDVEGFGLKEGKTRFPGRVLLAGFNNRAGTLLDTGDKESIRSFTRQLVSEAGKTGIIIGADCSLPGGIDRAHLRWVSEALDEMA